MGDGLSILGGFVFFILAGLCLFRRDLVWKLYSLEPKWSEENPERTAIWDERTRRYAVYYGLVGLVLIAFGLVI